MWEWARTARFRLNGRPVSTLPTLLMTGGNGAPFMLERAKTLSKAIPVAKLSTLDGQTHDVHPEALAPVLVEFFAA